MKKILLLSSVLLLSGINTANAQPLEKQVTVTGTKYTYAKTKYPMVYAHGLFGFGSVVGVDYFYQILPDLARNGASAWYTTVSPVNSSEVRGEQLLQQVENIIAITGQPKVNLVGHSHGGQSVRYISGVAPDKVASVTTIASGNKGAGIADLILKLVEGNFLEAPVTGVINALVSPVLVWAQGQDPKIFPYDSKAAAKSLSTAGSLAYNQKFPLGVPTSACGDGPAQQKGIYFFSFMGNSAFNTIRDPSDSGMLATSLLQNNRGDNDGIVGRCDAKFGKTIRDTHNWNHFDEINHVLGIRGILSADPVQVHREHASRLKALGL